MAADAFFMSQINMEYDRHIKKKKKHGIRLTNYKIILTLHSLLYAVSDSHMVVSVPCLHLIDVKILWYIFTYRIPNNGWITYKNLNRNHMTHVQKYVLRFTTFFITPNQFLNQNIVYKYLLF